MCDCPVVRWLQAPWASRCHIKPTSPLGVFMGSSGTFPGNFPLFFFDVIDLVCSSIGYFPLCPCFHKFSLLTSDDHLGKNINQLHASSLPQIHQNTSTPLAPLRAHLIQPALPDSAAKILG